MADRPHAMTQAAARKFAIRSVALFVVALAALGAAGARADTYPNRPVRLIVPFAAGGLNDVVARLVAPYLERSLGQPFVVDNRPAASGIVGTDATAKAPPDGYTLLMVASSFTVVPATNPKLPYDAERDLAPIVMVAKNSLLFLVNPKVPANSLAEFVALADPGWRVACDRERKPQPRCAAARSPHGRGARLSQLRGNPMDRLADHSRYTEGRHRAHQRGD